MPGGLQYQLAVEDFRRARRRASLENIMASLRGRSSELLSYEEVRKQLKMTGSIRRGLQDIPLDAIVGSVGRYADFTRSFLPVHDDDETRWAKIGEIAREGLGGYPPIDVFQINDAYFVSDGNHRVSVARQMGANTIEAYVTEIKTKVSISKEIQPDDLILKAGYADFLEATQIDEYLPDVDLNVTAPGKYRVLKEHIDIHSHYLQTRTEREVSSQDAVVDWYQKVYRPVEEIIRQRGLLRDFPERTPTDLFLWIMEHRQELRKHLGWHVSPEVVATDLSSRFSSRLKYVLDRISQRFSQWVTPVELESGPAPGQWRKEEVAPRREDRLFTSILVPVNGREGGWLALEQAISIARHEDGKLYGLHVVPKKEDCSHETALLIQRQFLQRCQDAGIPGECAIVCGDISRRISTRARWTDLVVMNIEYPLPGVLQPFAHFRSTLRTIIRSCPRPIFSISRNPTDIQSALLAYNDSPKAKEALFVSAYLAGHLHIPLVVLTVRKHEQPENEILNFAREYLEKHGVDATYITTTGNVRRGIMRTAKEHQCDLLIMGGYGRRPLLEIFLGSTIDQILRTRKFPVLICR